MSEENTVLNLLGADQPGQMEMAITPVIHHHVAKIKFGKTVVDFLNKEIEATAKAKSDNYERSLVGQIRNNKDSSQLKFDLSSPVGVQLLTVLNSVGTSFLQQGYKKQSYASCFDVWTNRAYAEDYNPLHNHGTTTAAGLSGFMWLKLPEEMEAQKSGAQRVVFGETDGQYDGWTHMAWDLGSRTDIYNLKLDGEKYVQPEIGTLYVFPKWLHHQVLPFSGPGERRSIAMNWNVIESENEIKNIMDPNEYKDFMSILPPNVDKSVPFLTTIGGAVLNVKLNENE
jgi:hypothetical protein